MDSIERWMVLTRAPGLSHTFLKTFAAESGCPTELVGQKLDWLLKLGLSDNTAEFLTRPDLEQLDKDLKTLDRFGIQLITHVSGLPELLRQTPDCPLWLFCRGDTQLLQHRLFAIVGSRKPSWLGKELAFEFAQKLTQCGLSIVSGLALGIDGSAHRAALESGKTVAVCATGLETTYPRKHQDLAEQIAEQGLLISEYPPGTAPCRYRFPERNRIISGLSLGTLVVEAAKRSGSLITARLAAEQGREVFAIPGALHNPMSRGCHRLIQQGAKLTETVQDILEELPMIAQIAPQTTNIECHRQNKANLHRDGKESAEILEILKVGPMSIDQLVQESGLTSDQVSSMLLRMELGGLVATAPGGAFIRLN